MAEIMILGVPVTFPFEPYDVQKSYMEKVIESLQNSTNAVLESPTGTGKTLSLLCSSLAWLLVKKAQLQLNAQVGNFSQHSSLNSLADNLKSSSGKIKDNKSWGMPKIIYASRTHSQLTQAMQELKRSHYRHMKAAVLGSRDQMCIHPEVSRETNNLNKVHMCQLKVKARTCFYYNNIESKKDDKMVKGDDILDIEDLVSAGKKLNCCPYYLAKELKQDADIVFMPYNYLLDPKSRKANGVELMNNIVILDEAHNVEKMCEESASLQIKSTDIALCIDEITHVMKSFSDSAEEQLDLTFDQQPKDFTCDDLCILKEMMLAMEKTLDETVVENEGSTYPGSFIYDFLSKVEIREHNQMSVINLMENLIQFLSTANASPFQRKGIGLQKIVDLLNVVFSGTTYAYKERVKLCYKVHIQNEERKSKKSDSWTNLKVSNTKVVEKVLSYWCFSPGFGMKQLLDQKVRSIILTSGTLAPLKPLISELDIPIGVSLENPHIVKSNQICIKIISQGPDGEQLNSNFQNRNNPKYISSLGRTILSFCRVVPDGLLVFFPSYPIMAKCQEMWQSEGIWSSICNLKPIFVEPQGKVSFNSVINDYYSKISDSNSKGACFMAVCRGKVSEGLDFADMNGRAVLITGLPFPPLKDPRIVLKKKYLEELRKKNKDYLSGDDWYSLEATRAVNQAIGRVLRHQNDYGAILLCDCRFNSPKLKSQLSAWLKEYITTSNKFGEAVSEVCRFFKNAQSSLPSPKLKPLLPFESNSTPSLEHATKSTILHAQNHRRIIGKTTKKPICQYPNSNEVYADFSMEFYKNAQSSTYLNEFKPRKTTELFKALDNNSEHISQKLESNDLKHKSDSNRHNMSPINKKKKLKIKPFGFEENLNSGGENSKDLLLNKEAPTSLIDFVKETKALLPPDSYKKFQTVISTYRKDGGFDAFLKSLVDILESKKTFYLLKGMKRFLKEEDKEKFQQYCDNVNFS